MSEIEESDSHDENSESDHDDGLSRETLLISCKCEKCLDLESFCCLQFSKIKKECQENGELNVTLKKILIFLNLF